MLINLTELFTCEGKDKNYSVDIDMTVFHGPTADYNITKKSPVILRIRNIGNKCLYLEGNTKLTLSMPCDRCLEPVDVLFEPEFDLELDMNKSVEERIEELDEQPYLCGYNLDVDKLVREELLLNLPMKILCSENCKGICNRCGTNLNHGTCNCDTGSVDPRMSAIQDLFKQFKEV